MAKTERIEARVAPEQRNVLEEAASLRGESLSGFVVGVALREARAVVDAATVTVVPADFAAAFDAILAAPPGAHATQFEHLAGYEPLREGMAPFPAKG